MSTIIHQIENGVGYIRLNRPDKYNAFIQEMAYEMQSILKTYEADATVRAIYITGNGKAFCAGEDLVEAADPNGPGMEFIVANHFNPIIQLIRSIPKPIVAAVNGVAAGAGANIALACDVVIATESASFIQAFSKIGLIPDSGGTYFLPRLIGHQKASALMMLGDKVSAAEAERLGMIYRYVSDDVFEEESHKIAEKLASMPTYGIGLTKEILNKTWDQNLNQQLETEKIYQVKAGDSHDHKEGMTAFLQKRKPNFIGK